MIYRKAIKCMPYFKNNVIQPDLTPRLNDVKSFLSSALIDHTIFDLGIHSLSELSGMTAGKYICLFQARLRQHFDTPVTGTATAGAATTITLASGASAVDDFYNGCVIQITSGTGNGQYRVITDYVGSTKVATVGAAWGTNPASGSVYSIGGYDLIETADITPHTSIYITGIKLDVYNNILSFINNVKIISGDCENKIKFYYAKIFLNTGTIEKYEMFFCEFIQKGGYSYIKNCEMNNSILYIQRGVINDNTDCKIIDCIIYCYEDGNVQEYYNTNFTNCVFKSESNSYAIDSYGTTNYNNCYIDAVAQIYFTPTNGITTVTSPIYYNGNVIITGDGVSNYNLQPQKKYYSDILGVNEQIIDFTQIDFDAFLDIECGVSREYTINTKTYAKGNYQHYRLAFEDDKPNPDVFKAIFSDDWILFVRRLDMEAVLCPTGTPKKISNLVFFENDGITAYDLISDSGANTIKDEYFLILAEDASNNKVVLLWYGNKLWKTVYSDAFDDTAYTILNCFQIWEADNYDDCSINFDNTTTGERTYIALADSPISGSMRFNNQDNEIKEA